jgi:spore maturation protein CgeB
MPAPSPSTREGFESPVTLEASSAFVAAEPPRHLTDLRLAAILDTFSLSCFEPECQVITFRPDNWRQVLTASPPHLLFVESAWNGNDGAWQYRIARYPAPPGRELPELVAWCKAQGIPTVFWNKEDPPHFDDFIDAARLFDVVLTTDAHCIPRYQELCGHDRVHVLPFAAQPRLHHPVQTEERNHKLCFAGTYYGNRFDARREGMAALLTPALEFDLDIYDRMHGAVGPGTEAYRFPEEYVPHIRGRLPYPEMVAAYRRYRAFLNVNSVTDSPSMFSRRVFELLACGTPVVSTESAGIRALFPGLVPVVTTPAQARAAFAELLTDDALWRRRSALGIRRVMERHGYRHRLERVCGLLGFGLEADKDLEIGLAVLPGPCPEITARHILGQSQPPTSILLLANEQAEALQKALADSRGQADIRVVEQFSVALADKGDAILAFFDGRHSYGPHYLADARLALDYSGAAVTGLRAHFALADGEARLDETLGQAHFMATEVMGAGLVCRAGALAPSVLDRVFATPTLTLDQACYARGPFEFLAGAVLDWGDERLEPVILEEPGDAGQA